MKGLQMPISSPSRADNFPPPLMRFLRSNTASRSRGRSRSRPMFYLRSKRNAAAAAAETAPEPSSPKVTCFGQVRTTRSCAKSKAKNRRHWLLRKTTENICLGFRRQKGVLRRLFCNCEIFSKSSNCWGIDEMKDSIRPHSDRKNNQLPPNPSPRARETRETEFLEASISVPKNALILTRCRSAPYKSSSLGGRIWGSPFPEPETSTDAKSDESLKQSPGRGIESKIKVGYDTHESNNESGNSINSCDSESKGISGDAIHPLLLTRCKSEPARTGGRLNPEPSFWRQKRVGTVEHRSLHNPR